MQMGNTKHFNKLAVVFSLILSLSKHFFKHQMLFLYFAVLMPIDVEKTNIRIWERDALKFSSASTRYMCISIKLEIVHMLRINYFKKEIFNTTPIKSHNFLFFFI